MSYCNNLAWSSLRLAVALAAAGRFASPAAAELKVVVTIKPVHGLVAQVMDGIATPALLVAGAASPHTYAMRPSDARSLSHADVFFRVSEAVEPFTVKVVKSLPETVRVVTLAEARGVALLNVRTSPTFEAHAHAGEGGHGPADHDRGASATDDGHDHGESGQPIRDGHVWLDPENAKHMVREIARVLVETSPNNAAILNRNAERLLADLDRLEAEIARDLDPVKDKPFVVFHDAYQYFERRFGLTALGSITVSPEVQPSAKRLSEIRRKIATLGASCVFAEPQFKGQLVGAVIEGTKARSGTLDPEGALVDPGPEAYATLLRNLASSLKSCLHEVS